MKFKSVLTLLHLFFFSVGQSQGTLQKPKIDTALAKKISIDSFCLCNTTLSDLQNIDSNLHSVEVEEMNFSKRCAGEDARYVNGKGYYSEKLPGMIFQKDQETNYISKIRLTKDFIGHLPDGTFIDMHKLLAKDVIKLYPKYDGSWILRGCSDYWNLTNDTLSFFVKIDKNKVPQYPLDEPYYLEKPIEGIDLLVSCYGVFKKANHEYDQLFDNPVYFLDSVNVTEIELQKYKPTDFAFVTVYKDSNAIKLIGQQGKYGVIYIETKKFVRNRYWNFFKNKSSDYLKVVSTPDNDQDIVYILNGKVLKTNYEAELATITDKNFIDLKVIDKDSLKKDYNVKGKQFGIVINITK